MTLPKNRGIDKDRMRIDKNIPNYLTILRIVAIPLIVMSFYFEDSKFAHRFGGIIFAAASLTDFFDGYLARRYDIVSNLGKMLDGFFVHSDRDVPEAVYLIAQRVFNYLYYIVAG